MGYLETTTGSGQISVTGNKVIYNKETGKCIFPAITSVSTDLETNKKANYIYSKKEALKDVAEVSEQIDAVGLKAIGWTDEDIEYLQQNINWSAEFDEYYEVPQELIDAYNAAEKTADGKMLTYKGLDTVKIAVGNKFIYCPKFSVGTQSSLYGLFTSKANLIAIPYIDTSSVNNTSYMFTGCSSLVSVPQFDTSKVTVMCNMFQNCYALVSVPQFDTSKVVNMEYMFIGCYSLVYVPQFNTSSVTRMSSIFRDCYSLVTIPQFDTSKVVAPTYMFCNCYSLITVPLLNTINATDMTGMFFNCYSLVSVPLFNTSNVKYMTNMFQNCYSLVSVPLFNTSNVTSMVNMFYSCNRLTSIPLFDTRSVTSFNGMCVGTRLHNIPPLNTLNGNNLSSMFSFKQSLCKSVKLISDNNTKLTNVNSMLSDAVLLQKIYINNTSAHLSSSYYSNMYSNSNANSMIKIINLNVNVVPAYSIVSSNILGAVHNIVVPFHMVNEFKTATGWSSYADKIIANVKDIVYTGLTITADNVVGNSTTTTIHATFTYNGVNITTNKVVIGETYTVDIASSEFPQNTSTTSTVQRTITLTMNGLTASTTITQGVYQQPQCTLSNLSGDIYVASEQPLDGYTLYYIYCYGIAGNADLRIDFNYIPSFNIYMTGNRGCYGNSFEIRAYVLDSDYPSYSTGYIASDDNGYADSIIDIDASFTHVNYTNDGSQHHIWLVGSPDDEDYYYMAIAIPSEYNPQLE